MKKMLAALLLSSLPLLAHADEASVRKAMEAKLGAKVDGVAKTAYLGLYEIRVDGDILYTDEKVSAIIAGDLIDGKTMQNVTEERKRKLSSIKFSELPLDLAVKTVRGNGKRILATFEDPNCGYCKRLAKELATLDNVTVYTFLYPILSPDSIEKSKGVWCAADRSKAWNDLMVNGAVPPAGRCDAPIDKVLQLGRRLNIRGTPTLFFADGERIPGAVPLAQIEKRLAQIAEK